jgi:hypothetical protein
LIQDLARPLHDLGRRDTPGRIDLAEIAFESRGHAFGHDAVHKRFTVHVRVAREVM